MKRISIIAFIGVVIVVGVTLLLTLDKYDVYFYDAEDGTQYKIATKFNVGDTLKVKNRWFRSIEDRNVAGIIVIEGKNEYAYFAYTYVNMKNDDNYTDSLAKYQDIYNEHILKSIDLDWHDKEDEVIVNYIETIRLDIAVGTTEDLSEMYGSGVFTMNCYDSSGDIVNGTILLYVGGVSFFNENAQFDEEHYITQQVLYSTFSISDGYDVTEVLVPYKYMGGLISFPIGDSDNFTYDYHNNDVIMESENYMVEED